LAIESQRREVSWRLSNGMNVVETTDIMVLRHCFLDVGGFYRFEVS
jgi:hypothetical protein